MATLYKCPECEWIGTEHEMAADYFIANEYGDEAWSNWICPMCGAWHNLSDYEKVESK